MANLCQRAKIDCFWHVASQKNITNKKTKVGLSDKLSYTCNLQSCLNLNIYYLVQILIIMPVIGGMVPLHQGQSVHLDMWSTN